MKVRLREIDAATVADDDTHTLTLVRHVIPKFLSSIVIDNEMNSATMNAVIADRSIVTCFV